LGSANNNAHPNFVGFLGAGKVLGLDNCYGSHKAESVGGVEPIQVVKDGATQYRCV